MSFPNRGYVSLNVVRLVRGGKKAWKKGVEGKTSETKKGSAFCVTGDGKILQETSVSVQSKSMQARQQRKCNQYNIQHGD